MRAGPYRFGWSQMTPLGRVRVAVPLTETLPSGERVWSMVRLVVIATRQPKRYAARVRAARTAAARHKRAMIAAMNEDWVARKDAQIAALLSGKP